MSARRVRILVYNRLFDSPLRLEEANLPDGHEVTEDRRYLHDADAVVFHVPELPRLFRPRKPAGQLWILWTMECDAHYRRQRSAAFLRRFDLFMTYRRNADVTVSYIPDGFLERPVVMPPKKRSNPLVCSFVSSRVDRSGRRAYERELARHLEIHAYGRRGNRTIPDDRGRATKLETIAGYKFTLAFENAIGEDYVTEKFFDPLTAGSVPVYLGAPNVADFAPTDGCYIDTRDFAGPRELAEHLRALAADDRAYHRLLDWRAREVRPRFRALSEEVGRHPFERLCERIIEYRLTNAASTAG